MSHFTETPNNQRHAKPFLSGTRVHIPEEMCTVRHKIASVRLSSSSPRSHDLWPVRGDKWWICAARPKQRGFSHLNRQNQQLTPVTINFKNANCFSWQLRVCVRLWGRALFAHTRLHMFNSCISAPLKIKQERETDVYAQKFTAGGADLITVQRCRSQAPFG